MIRVREIPFGSPKEPGNVDAILEKGGKTLLGDHDDQGQHNKCHEHDARARDTQTYFFKVAFWHLLCHYAPFVVATVSRE